MSTDIYLVDTEKKLKIMVASHGFSGFQHWYMNEETGHKVKELMQDCLDLDNLKFVYEQSDIEEECKDLEEED